MLQHVANTRCVALSVGYEPGSPALDHFELIDFAMIVCVQGRTSIHLYLVDGLIRDLYACSFTDVKLTQNAKRFIGFRGKIIYMTFPFQILFEYQINIMASSNHSSELPMEGVTKFDQIFSVQDWVGDYFSVLFDEGEIL